MPQIEQLAETYTSQIFWLLVIFGLVFFIVGRGMVPKVMETVASRDQQIAGDLAAAQAARDAADEQEGAWRSRENASRAEAQALIAKAKAEAAVETEAGLSAAQRQIDARLAEAELRIDAARNAAAAEIENVASDATQDIVRRLAGVEVEPAAAHSAVREVMAHG
jgi:F-type H+-transporting ATPase subunit b